MSKRQGHRGRDGGLSAAEVVRKGAAGKEGVLVFRRVCWAFGDPAPYLGAGVHGRAAAKVVLRLAEMCGF